MPVPEIGRQVLGANQHQVQLRTVSAPGLQPDLHLAVQLVSEPSGIRLQGHGRPGALDAAGQALGSPLLGPACAVVVDLLDLGAPVALRRVEGHVEHPQHQGMSDLGVVPVREHHHAHALSREQPHDGNVSIQAAGVEGDLLTQVVLLEPAERIPYEPGLGQPLARIELPRSEHDLRAQELPACLGREEPLAAPLTVREKEEHPAGHVVHAGVHGSGRRDVVGEAHVPAQ